MIQAYPKAADFTLRPSITTLKSQENLPLMEAGFGLTV